MQSKNTKFKPINWRNVAFSAAFFTLGGLLFEFTASTQQEPLQCTIKKIVFHAIASGPSARASDGAYTHESGNSDSRTPASDTCQLDGLR